MGCTPGAVAQWLQCLGGVHSWCSSLVVTVPGWGALLVQNLSGYSAWVGCSSSVVIVPGWGPVARWLQCLGGVQ